MTLVGRSPSSVDSMEMIWGAEHRASRLLAASMTVDPEDSASQVTKNRFRDLRQALEKDGGERRLFEQFLEDGQRLNPWYCLLALEHFRTEGDREQEDRQEKGNDMALRLECRRSARLLFETFCNESSPLFVDSGEEQIAALDKILWSTPDHVNLGRRIFNGVESKVFIEMERKLIPEFIASQEYKHTSFEECVALVPHATLGEILSFDKTNVILSNYLAAKSVDSRAVVLSSEKPVQYVSLWGAVERLREEHDSALQARRAESVAMTFVDLFHKLLPEKCWVSPKSRVAPPTAHQAMLILGELQRRAFFEIRDRYFTDFCRSVQYITCLSLLSGHDAEELHSALDRSGKPFAKLVTGKRGPETSEKRSFLSSISRKFRAAPSQGQVGLAPALSNDELRFGANVNPPPREWRHATMLENEERCSERLDRVGKSSCQQGRKLALGLEGLIRNNELRKAFVSHVESKFFGTRYASRNLLELVSSTLSLSAGFPWTAAVRSHVLEILTNADLSTLLPGALCSDAMAVLAGDRFPDSALSTDSSVRSLLAAARNVLLRRFWLPFQAVRKLEQAFPLLVPYFRIQVSEEDPTTTVAH